MLKFALLVVILPGVICGKDLKYFYLVDSYNNKP